MHLYEAHDVQLLKMCKLNTEVTVKGGVLLDFILLRGASVLQHQKPLYHLSDRVNND